MVWTHASFNAWMDRLGSLERSSRVLYGNRPPEHVSPAELVVTGPNRYAQSRGARRIAEGLFSYEGT